MSSFSVQTVLDTYVLAENDVVLIDTGNYPHLVTIGPADSGFRILGLDHQASITSISLNQAIDVTIQGVSVSNSLSLTHGSAITIHDVAGPELSIDGTDSVWITNTACSGATVSGNAEDVVFERCTVSSRIRIGPATDLALVNNVFYGSLSLLQPATGLIINNDIQNGLAIDAPFAGLIEQNYIHGNPNSRAGIGVSYNAAAVLSGNRIHDHEFGVVSTVFSAADAFGFVGEGTPNKIYHNDVGVVLDSARIQGQHIYENRTGISGTGTVGGEDWNHPNRIAANVHAGIGEFTGVVQFNRIESNDIGVFELGSPSQLTNNLIYQNSSHGILISSGEDFRIASNTLFTNAGDNIHLEPAASNVEILNNILWIESDLDPAGNPEHNIHIESSSPTGYYSDYNLLHSGPSGALVYWTRDFTDVLDWQADVALFDLHSRGTTTINPLGSEPKFENRFWDEYTLLEPAAGLDFTSPGVDDGCEILDYGQGFHNLHNLLQNGDFESGLDSWTTTGSVTSVQDRAWANEHSVEVTTALGATASQTVDLLAEGFDASTLDDQSLKTVFSGRVWSYSADTYVRATFLDAQSDILGSVDAFCDPYTANRWQLVGDAVVLPAGSRYIKFTFDPSDNGAALDHTRVHIVPESRGVDVGAFATTALDRDSVTVPAVKLRSHDLYFDCPRDSLNHIRWDSFGNRDNSELRIDLYQDGTEGPILLTNLAETTADDGHFQWMPANYGIDYGTYGLRIHISLADNPLVFDQSSETFTVPEAGEDYFVDDSNDAGDEYTPDGIGSNRNTGKLSTAPKPYAGNLLRTYDLVTGDTLYIDTGQYSHIEALTLSGSSNARWGIDEGFSIQGPRQDENIAEFISAVSGDLVRLNDADYVSISHITLSGGWNGIVLDQGTSDFEGRSVVISSPTRHGIFGDDANVALLEDVHINQARKDGISISGSIDTMLGCLVENSGDDGLQVTGDVGRLAHNQFLNNVNWGAYIRSTVGLVAENNTMTENRGGIYVRGNGDLALGDIDLSLGNIFVDNWEIGIDAEDSVLTGNVVRGSDIGIRADNTHIVNNIVHQCEAGILAISESRIAGNRLYANGTGITTVGSSNLISQNVVYSNHSGVNISRKSHLSSRHSSVRNNLVYDNTGSAIRTEIEDTLVVNNTIVQPQQVAVRFDGNSTGSLKNNIIFTTDGACLRISEGAQGHVLSDYNDLYVSGNGAIVEMQSVAYDSLSAWRGVSLQDVHSFSKDPLFVDPDGADNSLGYQPGEGNGFDDDFHIQSSHAVAPDSGSYHGGSFAPVLDPETGHPTMPLGAWTIDAASSPALDRGDPDADVSAEPSPNGSFVNLGAFGASPQASTSTDAYVLVTYSDGGESWPAGRDVTIRWRLHSLSAADTVTIRLLNFPEQTVQSTIQAAAPNTGSFTWSIPNDFTPGDYLMEVTRNDAADCTDTSNNFVEITEPVYAHYVNDATVQPGDWTTAPGNDANDGLSPSSPMALISSLLETYGLGDGDVVYVDAGEYTLQTNLRPGVDDSGVRIEGYHDAAHPERVAILDRGNTAVGSWVVEMGGADAVTLSHLHLRGGYHGIHGPEDADSDDWTVTHCAIYDNLASSYYSSGIYVDASNDGFRLVSSEVYGNGAYGVYIRQASEPVLVDNVIHDHPGYTSTGIRLYHTAGAVVEHNQVFGQKTGIQTNGVSNWGPEPSIRVGGNTVYDNEAVGIDTRYGYGTLVEANEVYGHDADAQSRGLVAGRSVTARGNTVHDNTTGIVADATYATVASNRVYQNETGIHVAERQTSVRGNTVYSNSTGVRVGNTSGSPSVGTRLGNNLIYANDNAGIVVDGDEKIDIVNNTVYQTVGDAVSVVDAENTKLWNNILQADSGHCLAVAADAQVGFDADYNLFYRGEFAEASVIDWGDEVFATLADWQTHAGFDSHSLESDPSFIDVDGSDNVLGYTAADEGYDGGLDDNFFLEDDSPAIDCGTTWQGKRVDLLGLARVDDPNTPNTGDHTYYEQPTDSRFFEHSDDFGTPLNWRAGNYSWNHALPFSFPFFEQQYSEIYVSSNGFLQFEVSSDASSYRNSLDALNDYYRIATLWDDLTTSCDGGDVFYIDGSAEGWVGYRWVGQNVADGSPVDFVAVLHDDGTIHFEYGAGNHNLTPTIGIAAGDGYTQPASYNGRTDLDNVTPIEFALAPGIHDLGAIEHRGDSSDVFGPQVLGSIPSAVHEESSAAALDQIYLVFSEVINPVDLRRVENFQLTYAGPNGTFGDVDDSPVDFHVLYQPQHPDRVRLLMQTQLSLEGSYQLRAIAPALRDLAGNMLDGDTDGSEGGDYVRQFSIDTTAPVVAVDSLETYPGHGSRQISVVTQRSCHRHRLQVAFRR